jgi:16S rRNA (guanine966-N2)-methyltransferase
VREALASALESRDAFHDVHVLDLFAGTGALSFEAMSRGARDTVAIDHEPRVLRELKQSARALGLADRTWTLRLDLLGDAGIVAAKVPEVAGGFGLVFADAPYGEIARVPALLGALVDAGRIAPDAWIVVERPANHEWAFPNGLAPDAEYRYGQTGISLGVHPSEKGT